MPIIPSFSINAIANPSPAAITLVDTSTGSDGAIASRQVLIYSITNTLLFPAQAWAYANPSIVLSLLTQDTAANVIVNWLAADGVTILYTTSQIFAFKNFSEQFYYSLIQDMAANPNIIIDTNFWENLFTLRLQLDNASLAISTGQDIYAAQNCIGQAIYMVQNHQLFWNE